MNHIYLAIRAIGAEFARQLWVSSLIVAIIISSLAVALLLWLSSLSGWWWLLAIPFGISISVMVVLLIVFFLLINHVRPSQTSIQKEQVRLFVDKLRFASEITSTPKVIILFRTIRSIAAPKSDSYLKEIFETKNLKQDFQDIARTFKEGQGSL